MHNATQTMTTKTAALSTFVDDSGNMNQGSIDACQSSVRHDQPTPLTTENMRKLDQETWNELNVVMQRWLVCRDDKPIVCLDGYSHENDDGSVNGGNDTRT